jgi:uncharacterized surface anchored protein
MGHVAGIAVAGPTCPVVTDPPQSECDARPVADARLRIVDVSGSEVTILITDADGRFEKDLAPGAYQVKPLAVDGLLGTAPPVNVTVASGEEAEVTVSYDTGIR